MRRLLVGMLFCASITVAGCSVGGRSAANETAPAATAPVSHLTPPNNPPAPSDVAAPVRAEVPADTAPAPASRPVDPLSRDEVRYRELTIPSGTTLRLALTSGVSSKGSSIEDAVHATLRAPVVVDGVVVIPSDSTVSGHVTEATRSGRVKGRARVGFRFTSLRAADTRYDIRTTPIVRQARGTKKQDAVKIGVGAGAGALVGAIAGGKKGAAIGSGVGAAGGSGVVLATRGEEVALGPGAVVTTRLTAPLTVRVRVP